MVRRSCCRAVANRRPCIARGAIGRRGAPGWGRFQPRHGQPIKAMEYRILGPFEVRDSGRVVALGGEKQRAVFAILLLHRNEVVSADRLIDDLWGASPPASALRTLQAYVSRLRRALGANGGSPAALGDPAPASRDGVLVTKGHGYLLRVAPSELDLERFKETADRGRDALAAGDPEQAAAILRKALALWRGPPLADFAYAPFAQPAIAQLEEIHIATVEERLEADLALGQARDLVGELRDLVERHPLRERVRGQLMLALYRSGRQAEALESYQAFRRALSEQLGLDPGPGLQQLERAILNRDSALSLSADVAPAQPQPPRSSTPRPAGVRDRRRRLAVALSGSGLLGLVVAAVVVASSGGQAAPATVIPGNSVGAISPSGDGIQAVVPLGTSPSALAAGDGSVWVANYNAGTVSRIEPAARAVVETIPVGTTPSGIAAGAGAIWVTNNYGATVSRIDPAVDRVVQTTPVGNAPNGVAVADGSVWVANSSDGTLTRIDAVTGAVIKTTAIGGDPTDLAVGAGGVWVSDEAGDRVLRVDPRSYQLTASINVGSGPTAIVVAFGSVWVANSLDGTVSRIDPTTNTVGATIAVGDGAGTIAVDSGAVWIASQYAGTISRLNPVTDTVTRTIKVGDRPAGLAFAGGRAWFGNQAAAGHRGGTLTVLTIFWPVTIDPVLTQVAPALQLTNDGLTTYRRVGGSGSVQIVPDLAVSLPSPTDGDTTYTFQLRRGIRFSNGELVRPEDFRRALERELILGSSSGGSFADVVGGAACRLSHCDLSRGVVCDDAANTVTFHLVAPNPEFLARLTLVDAIAVPAGTPFHDIGLHGLPATGPYKFDRATPPVGALVRNPYFREWSHAARPDGYPDRIVYRLVPSRAAELAAVAGGRADYTLDGVPPDRLSEVQTRFASQLYVNLSTTVDTLVLNTRMAPFNDIRVRRAISYAVDRAKIAHLLGQKTRPTCQVLPPYLPGYRRYCPYTLDPTAAGVWNAPNLAEADRLIAASHTRGTPITVWDLGPFQTNYAPAEPYLVAVLDRLGYPTHVKDFSLDANANGRFGDSRTGAQAAIDSLSPSYLSASQFIQVPFACQSFIPGSTGNANTSEFCDHHLDSQIQSALAADSANSPDAGALWARADRALTDEAPVVPLTTGSAIDFVSSRVGDYQYSFQQGILLDQLWVR
jgi:YVTN family beta-propeller protein